MKSATLIAAATAVGLMAALGSLALAGGDAKPADEPTHHARRDRCLMLGRIYSWHAAKDGRSLVVESDTHEKYKVDLMGFCPGLAFTQTVAFKVIGGGGALSCLGAGDMVIYRDGVMTNRCYINRIGPYVPTEDRPKDADRH